MIKSTLTGKPLGPYDQEINEWIKKRRFTEHGHLMEIFIDNRNDKVYRVIEVSGFNDFCRVSDFLSSLGMIDIKGLPFVRAGKCDSRYRIQKPLPEVLSHLLVTNES